MTRVLITGAAGFAGSHMASLLAVKGFDVVALDSLTYAGRLDSLAAVSGLRVVCHDLAEPLPLREIGPVEFIVHNAAESHVDRSISDTRTLVRTNIVGTLNLLEAARELRPLKLLYTSTDEVFGPRTLPAVEDDRLAPTNPYAATKAAGEMLMRGYRSFGLPVVVLRTVNMFGEYQHPEKFVPRVIKKILAEEEVEVHCSPSGEVGSRQWVYVGHQADKVWRLLSEGEPGSFHHLIGPEVSNLDMAELVARLLGKRLSYRKTVSSRPFHDLHYSISGEGPLKFERHLEETVRWFSENRGWL